MKDKEDFVEPLARELAEMGVAPWLDIWEIRPGDSLVRKLFEEGLDTVDAVIVVVSASSAVKPWVREELDAAVVRRITSSVRLIPVRLDHETQGYCLKTKSRKACPPTLKDCRVPPRNSRYPQIAAQLRTRILAGEWLPGSTLPTLDELAAEYGADKNTISRAISEVLEPEGLVWAVPKRGTIVRHGMARPHRLRGNLVKRNVATGSPGYSWPSASGQEVWRHHVPATAEPAKLEDPRIARLLKVAVGDEILLRHRVTGPETEPPFQISNSWIHPRVADIPGVAGVVPGPISDWVYRIEKAGHGPLSWMEYHRARLPTGEEATELQIPATMPVLEIVRVGRSALDGAPVEVTEYVIPSDRVETVHELHRDESAAWPWPEDSDAVSDD